MKGKVGGWWNKIFMEIFMSMLHGFLPFPLVSVTELCSFWYGLKDHLTLHKLGDKVRAQSLNLSFGAHATRCKFLGTLPKF